MALRAAIRRSVGALGAELAAAIVVLTGSAWAFAWTAEELLENDTHVDTRVANWLHGQATSELTAFFKAVTALGNVPVLAAVVVVAALVLRRVGRPRELRLLVLAAIGTQVLTFGLKLGFQRERPFFADPLATESTYSFPSGHASASLAVYGTIGYIVARHAGGRRTTFGVLAAASALVLLIGFSRLYLGVHFVSDVIAGFSVGLAWVSLCVVLLHLQLRLRERRQTSR